MGSRSSGTRATCVRGAYPTDSLTVDYADVTVPGHSQVDPTRAYQLERCHLGSASDDVSCADAPGPCGSIVGRWTEPHFASTTLRDLKGCLGFLEEWILVNWEGAPATSWHRVSREEL